MLEELQSLASLRLAFVARSSKVPTSALGQSKTPFLENAVEWGEAPCCI